MKRRIAIVLGCVAATFVAVQILAAWSVRAPTADAALAPPVVGDGVWIWTRADADVFARGGAHGAAARPGVLVLSIDADRTGRLSARRGLAPSSVKADAIAAVVRIEDAVAPRLDEPTALATELDARLARLMAELDAADVRVTEVQLDFDVPVRRLPAWAEVVGRLAKGSLAGAPIWVTSIPAHLADPSYGDLFRGVVAGHVFQTFDTGLPCGPTPIATARDRLRAAHMPFRVGVATFERAKGGRRTTDHACWANATRELGTADGYAGAWIFPAGRAVDDAFSMVKAD